MDQASREQLIARFSDYLDATEEVAEDVTEDPTDDTTPDLFTLLAEVAALKNEVKIESRQVKTALDAFRELFDTVQQTNTRLDEERARRREADTRERQAAERDALLEQLDLRDRLQAGHQQICTYRPGWFARRGGADRYVAGIAEGQAMILRRLDESLARRGVLPVATLGRSFDPATMHAADTADHPDRADGEIVAETRAGYLHHGRLLRAAEVIVNKQQDSTT